MEVVHKKDLNDCFMIVDAPNIDMHDYRINMVITNKIKGLCSLDFKEFNNQKVIYYHTTGYDALSDIFDRRKMGVDDIKKIISSIHSLVETMKEYMLDTDKILFDDKCIFCDRESGEYYFCYYPCKSESLYESLKALFNHIIEVIDYSDKEAIMVAYGLQQLIESESITITEIVDYIRKERNKSNCDDIEYEYIKQDNKLENIENQNEVSEESAGGFTNNKSITGKKINSVLKRIKQRILNVKGDYEILGDVDRNDNVYYGGGEDIEGCFDDACIVSDNNQVYQYATDINEIDETVVLKGYSPIGIILKPLEMEKNIESIMPRNFPCIVGKSVKSADYIIEDNTISRVHMRIEEEIDGYYIEDLNSTNGTFLNGDKLKPHILTKLNVGDTIMLSNIQYIVC